MVTDEWVVSLVSGSNSLQWESGDLCTHYWIQRIEVLSMADEPTLSLLGPAEPLSPTGGTFEVEIWGDNIIGLAGAQFALTFAREGVLSPFFCIATDPVHGHPEAGNMVLAYNTGVFGTSAFLFYDSTHQSFGILPLETGVCPDLSENTWLATVSYDYPPIDVSASGRYTISVDPDFSLLADSSANIIPFRLTAGQVDMTSPRDILIVGHDPSGNTPHSVSAITLDFSTSMDIASFSFSDDILDFTGPEGPVEATGHAWLSPTQLRILFPAQTALGLYTITLGTEISDTEGDALQESYLAHFVIVPSSVLFVNVHGSTYDADAVTLFNTLGDAQASADWVNLSQNGQVASKLQNALYDQIWVFDLSSWTDSYPDDWQAIASWFNAQENPGIICDARMISSYWGGESAREGRKLTQNYYENLRAVGGGLLLGTDHSSYHSGINTLNQFIGLDPFHGTFYLDHIPVDSKNRLMYFPNDMGVTLLDNSSPGQVPYGLQPNGRILYSVAWHQNNVNTPGISSTIEGETACHVAISAPEDGSHFLEGREVSFAAEVISGEPPFTFEWTSHIDGLLSVDQAFELSDLTPGSHLVTVLCIDSLGGADDDTITVNIVPLPDLAVLSLEAQPTVLVGKTLQVTYSVKNVGSTEMSQPWIDALYLSLDPNWDEEDLLLGTVQAAPLLPEAEYQRAVQVAIPSEIGVAGTYFLILVVDDDAEVQEIHETNNGASRSLEIKGPDLAIALPSIAETTIAPGEELLVPSTVSNNGNADAGPFAVRLYVSTDDIPGNEDDLPLTPDTFVEGGLPVAASPLPIDVRVMAALGTPNGTYHVVALIDALNAVDELSESDNWSITPNPVLTILDTPPDAELTLEPTDPDGLNGWYQSVPVISISATDAESDVREIHYWWNAEAPHIVSGASVGIAAREGENNLSYFAVDEAGLQSPVESHVIKLDTSAPTTSASLQGDGPHAEIWYYSAVEATLHASGGTSGVLLAQYKLDAGEWVDFDPASQVHIAAEGEHTLFTKVVSIAGRQATSEAVFGVDTSTPAVEIEIQGPVGGPHWYSGPVDIAVSSDGGSAPVTLITVSLDGSDGVTYEGPITIVSEGSYVVTASLETASGKTANTAVTFDLDTAPPSTTYAIDPIAPDGNQGWYLSQPTVNLTANDTGGQVTAIHYWWNEDPATVVPAASAEASAPPGQNTLHYFAVDHVSRSEQPHEVMIKHDPAFAVDMALAGTAGASGWYISHVGVSVVVTASESGIASAEYRLDGGEWNDLAEPYKVMLTSEGTNDIAVRAVSISGRQATAEASIKVDTQAPAIANVRVHTLSYHSAVISWTTSEPATSEVRYGLTDAHGESTGKQLELLTEHSIPLTGLDQNTSYHFIAVSEDIAGNASTSPDCILQTYDWPDLEMSGLALSGRPVLGQSMKMTWTVTNIGAGPAIETWIDRVYLSQDDQIDGQDRVLKSVSADDPLGSGEVYTRNISVQIPADLVDPGPYHVIVKADSDYSLPEHDESNNTAFATDTVMCPDLIARHPFVPGIVDTGRQFTVVWSVFNEGDTPASDWADGIYLSSDTLLGDDTPLDSIAGFMPLSPGESYESAAEITIPPVPEGEYWILIEADHTHDVTEFDEVNNVVTVGPITVRRPNLVSAITSPADCWTGQTVQVEWLVTNQSQAHTAGIWTDCIYISVDAHPGSDTYLDRTPRPENLAPDAAYTKGAEVTIPDDLAEGEHWIVVVADDGNTLPESNEDDNVRVAGPFYVRVTPKADLQAQDVTLTGLTSIRAGETAHVDWIVRNTGAAATSGPWIDRIYLSTDQILDGSDRRIPSVFKNESALNPGEGYTQSGSFAVPGTLGGSYYVIVKADDDNYEKEELEDNNFGSSTALLVVEPVVQPYLAVQDVTVTPSDPLPGQAVTVTWKLTNMGSLPTGKFSLDHAFVLSADDLLSPGTDKTLDFHEAPASGNLGPGESTEFLSSRVTVPTDHWGDYYIIVWPDPPLWSGLDCSPLGASVRIQTPFPADLVVDEVTVEGPYLSGQPVQVSWTVRNAANATTNSGRWSDILVLSRDDRLDTTQDNIRTIPLSHEGALDFNQTYNGSASLPLPSDADGSYHLLLCTDTANQVYEGDFEDNNCGASDPITVDYRPPDLTVSGVTVTSAGESVQSVLSGTSVQVQWTVANNGAGATAFEEGTWTDSIVLSADGLLSDDDLILGTLDHAGALAAGVSYQSQQTVDIPLEFSAEAAYLFVRTDVGGSVHESDNSNNSGRRFSPFEVIWGPAELTVESLSVEQEGLPVSLVKSGYSVTVRWQVRNSGPGATAVDDWTDELILSADDVLDANDEHSWPVEHSGELCAGESYEFSAEIVVPQSFSAPAAYIFLRTDVGNVVYESDDENNRGRTPEPFEVVWCPPDLDIADVSVTAAGQPFQSVASNSVIRAAWRVVNNGPGATMAGGWKDRIYLSEDNLLDYGDVELAAVDHVGDLDWSQAYVAEKDVRIPIDFVGSAIYLFVVTDEEQKVYEFSEDNNTSSSDSFDVTWAAPDLVIEDLTVSHGIPRGHMVNLSWTVKNAGGASDVAEWQDKVYLSDDRWLSEDDVELPAEHGPIPPHSGPLAYLATYSVRQAIPVSTYATGYLIVKTDANEPGQVTESAEDNNAQYVKLPSLQCDSDLVVSYVGVPRTAVSGQTVTVEWIVSNREMVGTSGAFWRDALYLSLDKYFDKGTDRCLGYMDHNGALPPARGYDTPVRKDVTIEYGISGHWYLIVVADSGGHICEIGEDNNVAASQIPIEIELGAPADLVVTDIAVPPDSVTLGEDISLSWTVRNDGEFVASGKWHDSIYISADETWDISDKKIGMVPHAGPLQPGESYTEALTAPLPGVVPGDYHIIVRTDSLNEVRESEDGENNNKSTSVDTVAVGITELALGITHSSRISSGEVHYFVIDAIPDQTLRVTLDCGAATGANDLYARLFTVPDRRHFDHANDTPFEADKTLTVPTTEAGPYYVTLYCNALPASPANYTLSADSIPFCLETVSPEIIGDDGQVTITLRGARFEAGMELWLRQDDNEFEAEWVNALNGTTARARFVFAHVPCGTYSAILLNSEKELAELSDAVVVDKASGYSVSLSTHANRSPRIGTVLAVHGILANSGNVDIPYTTVFAGFDADVRVGWLRPDFTVPFQRTFPDADWANDSPTASSEIDWTRDSFVVPNLPPHETVAFVCRFADFKPGQFQYEFSAYTDMGQQLDQMAALTAEAVRTAFVEEVRAYIPAELHNKLADHELWLAYFRSFVGLPGGEVPVGDLKTDFTVEDRGPFQEGLSDCAACLAAEFGRWEITGSACFGFLYLPWPPQITWPLFIGCEGYAFWDYWNASYDCKSSGGPCYLPPDAISRGAGSTAHPIDPNEKSGPAGYGPRALVSVNSNLPYSVYFENLPSATAHAQQVTITDNLSPDLDWRTFQLGEIAFGDTSIQVPDSRPFYFGEVQLASGLIARIDAAIDIQTGVATWEITAIDPETGEMPEEADLGLLPPNDPETHSGEGYVTYIVKPKPDTPTGTEITNKATIIFDTNEPIETNEVFNTIDSGLPESQIEPLPEVVYDTHLVLTWSGSDDEGGAGLAGYTIYVSSDDGPFEPWLRHTTETSATFPAEPGHSYALYSIAEDNVGNSEEAPAAPDVQTYVPIVPPPVTVSLSPGSDSAQAGDNITNVSLPAFVGTTERFVEVTLRIVGPDEYILIVTVEPDDKGNWGYALGVDGPELPLNDGLYTVFASAVDGAGHISEMEATIPSVIIDTIPPSSAVNPLPEVSAPIFQVTWTADDGGGSGVASYDIFTGDSGGGYAKWMESTNTAAWFTGTEGRQYGFYSLACDVAGNKEQKSAADDAATTIGRQWAISGDTTMDCVVNISDMIFVRNRLNQPVDSGDNWQADVNNDGKINILDLVFVRNHLRAECPGE